MVSPPRPSIVESLSSIANKYATEKIRSLIKKQVTTSKRQGTWFGLTVQERSIVNLALSLKVSFRSLELMRAIVSVMKRLRELGARTFGRMLRGATLAWTYSEAAVSWGYPAAKSWRSDVNYIAFLDRFSRSPLSPAPVH